MVLGPLAPLRAPQAAIDARKQELAAKKKLLEQKRREHELKLARLRGGV